MKTTKTYGATLIDVMGNDLTVVNAARVSFDKASDFEEVTVTVSEDNALLGMLSWNEKTNRLKEADRRLISFLARKGHWTPFAHPQLSFRVSAPIFVARQLQKHQIGLAWNEVSRRYVDSEPVIYLSPSLRLKADNAKQGSSADTIDTIPYEIGDKVGVIGDQLLLTKLAANAVMGYEVLLKAGICPEQARMVLPQSMMTEWVWTGSLAAFARVCNQRLDPHAQRECRPVAEAIAKALEENFPVSWEALKNIKEPDEPAKAA